MRNSEIVSALEEWAVENKGNPMIWRTPVGRVLKRIMLERGNWRKRLSNSRGNVRNLRLAHVASPVPVPVPAHEDVSSASRRKQDMLRLKSQ